MDALDVDILTFLCDRENYDKYGEVIDKGLCTKPSWKLVSDIKAYYEAHESATKIDNNFLLWFRLEKNPTMKPEEAEAYGDIIKTITSRPLSAPVSDFVQTLEAAKNRSLLSQITKDLHSGALSEDNFWAKVDDIRSKVTLKLQKDGSPVVLNLEALAENKRDKRGYYWRCEDLNRAVGPICTGDFVVVGKRPEVGGTSFLASEITYMFEQMGDKNAIIFNNEEASDKVYTRLISSALGVDYRTLMSAPKHWYGEYLKYLDGRRIDIIHNTQMQAHDIRNALQGGDYGLCGVNVLLKVGVPGKLEDHDKLQFIGEELRRVSEHCPVIGITQADPTAEGVKYIHQDRLYKSETALQGEADVLLMIGKDYDEPETSRYFHVAKNKIPPAACCDLSMKHCMTEVNFDLDTGRFTSKLFPGGNSRHVKK